MPTLRIGKVWQVIRHFGVLFFCNLGTFKTVISNFVTTRQTLFPHIILPHVKYDHPNNVPVGQKTVGHEKSLPQICINSFLAHKLSHDR